MEAPWDPSTMTPEVYAGPRRPTRFGFVATLVGRTEREYLLNGIVRCACCPMAMWPQTYVNCRRCFGEHRASGGIAD